MSVTPRFPSQIIKCLHNYTICTINLKTIVQVSYKFAARIIPLNIMAQVIQITYIFINDECVFILFPYDVS